MAIDSGKLQEIENGLRVNDGVTLGPIYTGGPSSPVGLDLPVDSHYLQNSSIGIIVWRKYGSLTSDWIKQMPVDFYQGVTDETETSTTSSTVYLTKLTMTTPVLPLGDYRLGWRFKPRSSSINRGIDMRVQVSGVDEAIFTQFVTNASDTNYSSGFKRILGASGSKIITLSFKTNSSSGGATAFLSGAEFEFWRIN